jgi:PAS domain S-box-containing protein
MISEAPLERRDMRNESAARQRAADSVGLRQASLLVCLMALSATAQAQEILLLQPVERNATEHGAVAAAIRSGLANASVDVTHVYSEFVDPDFRQPRDREVFAQYLEAKYRDAGIDVVIALSDEAVQIVAEHRDIVGGVPLVFATRRSDVPSAIPKSLAVVVPFRPARTVELALRLQPQLAHVYVVSDTSQPDDAELLPFSTALSGYSSRLDLQYWLGLPQDELLERVARLPADSAVLYASVGSSSALGQEPAAELARLLAERANAPVYGLHDSFVGRGLVGGYMVHSEYLGAELARQTLRVLRGAFAEVVEDVGGSHVVDARALSRWNLDETRLPPDTELLFAPPSIWKLYQGWIITLLVLVAVQFALIVTLLIQSISRRRDRLMLAETAHRFRLARSAGKVGIWQWDLEKDELLIEPELRELLGYDARDEHVDVTAQIHAEDLPNLRRAARDHAQGLTAQFEIQHRMLDKNGNVRWFLSRGQAMVTRNRLIGTAIDITERKHHEDEKAQTALQLQEQRNELAHLGRAAMAGALSGAVAHELNQPLSAMMSNARAALQFLARGVVDRQEIKDILVDIESDGRRAGDVIRHLRSLLRRGEAQFEPVHLDQIIGQVLRLIHSDLVTHNIKVLHEPTAGIPPISADSVQLQQVLLNLLGNACDALKLVEPADRRISIRVHMSGATHVRLSVADNGCGFSEQNVDGLFKPFFTTKKTGLGLGLSISRSIVDAHGGRIWAERNRDGGATFHVDLAVMAAAEKVA